jgi:hypothetical protein
LKPPPAIGGWLVLVVLGLTYTSFRGALFLKNIFSALATNDTWSRMNTPGQEEYNPTYVFVLLGEMGCNAVIIALCICTIIFIFKKSKYAPRLAIAVYACAALYKIADTFIGLPGLGQPSPADIRECSQTTLVALIWIPYFLVSKRVKETFVL